MHQVTVQARTPHGHAPSTTYPTRSWRLRTNCWDQTLLSPWQVLSWGISIASLLRLGIPIGSGEALLPILGTLSPLLLLRRQRRRRRTHRPAAAPSKIPTFFVRMVRISSNFTTSENRGWILNSTCVLFIRKWAISSTVGFGTPRGFRLKALTDMISKPLCVVCVGRAFFASRGRRVRNYSTSLDWTGPSDLRRRVNYSGRTTRVRVLTALLLSERIR
mmetsp:Transcript_15133/g.27357  ORF Transcript_15133/g.27357 Transcript_15133/m.27357 type:complete len:218 (+) Transcript_15133:440-1093(+)